MVLALTPIFLDERMSAERSPAALRLIQGLARKAISLAGVPDAGIWEYRTEWKPQIFEPHVLGRRRPHHGDCGTP